MIHEPLVLSHKPGFSGSRSSFVVVSLSLEWTLIFGIRSRMWRRHARRRTTHIRRHHIRIRSHVLISTAHRRLVHHRRHCQRGTLRHRLRRHRDSLRRSRRLSNNARAHLRTDRGTWHVCGLWRRCLDLTQSSHSSVLNAARVTVPSNYNTTALSAVR